MMNTSKRMLHMQNQLQLNRNKIQKIDPRQKGDPINEW